MKFINIEWAWKILCGLRLWVVNFHTRRFLPIERSQWFRDRATLNGVLLFFSLVFGFMPASMGAYSGHPMFVIGGLLQFVWIALFHVWHGFSGEYIQPKSGEVDYPMHQDLAIASLVFAVGTLLVMSFGCVLFLSLIGR